MQCQFSIYAEKFLYCATYMHSISVFKLQSLAIHYIENLRVVSFSVATKCYSINCARKTFSYNLSQVQEMNYAFYFYPTVHSLKSTNIIQEDIYMLLQDNPGICGGNGIKTDLYRHAYIITSTQRYLQLQKSQNRSGN